MSSPPNPQTRACARQPLLYAAAAFAAGIAFSAGEWQPTMWWLFAAFAFLFAGGFFLRRRLPAAALLAVSALFVLGALTLQLADRGRARPPDFSQIAYRDALITAHVLREGRVRPAGKQTRQLLEVRTESVAVDGAEQPLALDVRLSVYSPAEDEEGTAAGVEPILYGERIRFTAKLRLPRNYGNPGAFDYRGWLARRGIAAVAWTRGDRLEKLPGDWGTALGHWRADVRRSALERMHDLWPAEQVPLIAAMLLGEDALLQRSTRLDFQRTGVYHVLVISGMHVGILAFLLFWVARRMRFGDVAASSLALLLTCFYAYLVDAGAPVVRATLMLAIYLATRLLYRGRSPLNAIGAAALGLLLVDPRALFDSSFQLTFLSVLAIAGLALPVLERTSLPYRQALRHLDSVDYDLSLLPASAQFRLDLRLLSGRLGRLLGRRLSGWAVVGSVRAALFVFDVLVLSSLMQIALALPMAWYFHRATLLGLAGNTLAVPVTGILLPSAALAVALSYISGWLAQLPAALAGWSLDWMTGVVQWLAAWRSAAEIRVATPTTAATLASAAALLFALFTIRRRRALAFAGVATLVLAAAWLLLPRSPEFRSGVLEITVLDVGQAESIFIVTPSGRTLLLDAAGATGSSPSEFDFGEEVVSAYLWSRGFTRLDAVALSHPHSDHASGMGAVMANFRPRELWVGALADVPAARILLASARAHGVAVLPRRAGESFDFGGARVEVLAPAADWQVTRRARDDDSLVMRLSFGETAVLLPGDISRRVERLLSPQAPLADLLKVPHHGSATSTTPELLESVRPRYAVVSAGSRNAFGHPRREVLERLDEAGVATFRTDMLGAISFYLDGSAVTPEVRSPR